MFGVFGVYLSEQISLGEDQVGFWILHDLAEELGCLEEKSGKCVFDFRGE